MKKAKKALSKNSAIDFTPNSLKILERRYLLKDQNGVVAETVEGMFERIAKVVAAPDAEYGYEEESQIEFYNLISSKKFFPNSPTFTGAGTPLGQLAACFVLPIEDDLGKHPDGIFSTLRNAALIQQVGGGNGFSFSDLRPKGTLVKSSMGKATGPVGFLAVYDKAFGEVAQGGVRRGANMAVLQVNHPDIRDFIKCKSDEGEISNFNISVAVTDEFMQAVKDDKKFDLVDPHSKKVVESPRAREIFEMIVDYAYKNGEPGVLFIDEANRYNPVPHLYNLKATNPCVTAETWVQTSEGPRQVHELVTRPFTALVNGVAYLSDTRGFWSTGIRPVFELRTDDGRSLQLTGNHRVLQVSSLERNSETSNWTEAKDLRPGDKVKLNDHRKLSHWLGQGARMEGWLLGLLVGDGTFSVGHGVLSFWGAGAEELAQQAFKAVKTSLKTRSDLSVQHVASRQEYRIRTTGLTKLAGIFGIVQGRKSVTNEIEKASSDFYTGFLGGLFDADGSVQDGGEKGLSVRLSQSNLDLLQRVQRMLLRLGINASVYANRRSAQLKSLPDGKGGYKDYATKSQHELVITKENLLVFEKLIGFTHPQKKQALCASLASRKARGPYSERFATEVVSITEISSKEVYDCSIPNINAFDANGLMVHNCGEQWLGKYENCCLGSINLLEHLNKNGQIDWESLKETIILSTRFLDNVVTANKYVDAVPQLRQAAENCRRIGLGFMGLADVMYSLGVRYGSEEGCDFAGQITEFIRYYSMLASIDLAKERGAFPAIKGSIFDAKKLKWQAPRAIKLAKKDFGRPKLDWSAIETQLRKYGIRNAAQTTVAPTGTISTVAGVEGYGCEPAFALAYSRNVYQAAGDEEKLTLTYVSPLFDKALDSLNLKEESKKKIVERVLETGSCQDIAELPEKIRSTFVVSADVLPEEHIKTQAAIQAFIDNSISKTCNFPPTAKKEDIAKVYMLGWEMGCKGLTVYVAGSRQEVVLETKETKGKKDGKVEAAAVVVEPVKKEMERGYRLTGTTYKLDTPQGKAFITVNKDAEGSPMEVFANVGKAGSDVAALSEALGRLISGWLRVSENPLRTAKEIVVQLLGIGGSRSVGFGSKRVSSIPDAVAKVLAEDCDFHVRSNGANIVENGVDKKEVSVFSHVNMCPECGNSSFINEEGCSKCYECGYSVC